jgi:Holliday junction resolvase RusA-like endonuclease
MKKLVTFAVLGYEACPWSVPFIGRNGGSFQKKKSRFAAGILNLPDWQAVVKAEAEKAMAAAGAPIQLGPTKTHIDFYTVTPPGRRHGEIWTVGVRWNPTAAKGKGAWVKEGKSQPDILNLFKGTEDAIESVTYGNDVQTSIISSARWYAPVPGVKVTVYVIEPGDYPGIGDPVPIVEVQRGKKRKRVAKG